MIDPVDDFKAELEGLRTIVRTRETAEAKERERLNAELEKLREDLTQRDLTVLILQERLAGAEMENDDLRDEIEELVRDNDSLVAQVDELQDRLWEAEEASFWGCW